MACGAEIGPVLMLLGAGCMFAVAVRHGEWRGGLCALGFLFLAVAGGICVETLAAALLAGVVGALLCRGTTRTAFRAICRNRRFSILAIGAVIAIGMPHHDRWVGELVLATWAVLFLKDKWKVFKLRVSKYQHLIDGNELIEIGHGTRRTAYRVGDTGYCAKFYRRIDGGKMKRSVKRDIGWRRFSKARNSSSQEVFVYESFRHRMPDSVRCKMPPVCARVYHPELGWGVIETYYTNPDGTPIIPYEFEIKRQKNEKIKREIYRQARSLLLELIRSSALFHEPGNFHVLFAADERVELKLIDFEPESKTLIPLEMVWPAFRRRKLARKAKRYLTHIREKYGVTVQAESEIG